MRVLFVDDEQAVLDAISRSLFHLEGDWEVETASTGTLALELMQEEPFDVIVSDMRMPSMDGATLLSEVHDRFPDCLRIILSGHTEQAAAMRAASVAHQFLTKPCSAEDVEAVIQRASDLRELMKPGGLRDTVGNVKALPPVPRLYSQLSQMLQDEAVGIAEVAQLISSDPAMSAKTLQVVNTSFFGIGRPITRVHDAVSRLGIEMVRNLAMMQEVFGGQGLLQVDQALLERQAQHSLVVGHLAAKGFAADRSMRDDAFMAGILHDVGKLVLFASQPAWQEDAHELMKDTGCPSWEAEIALLGADHGQVGAYLLGVWGLPNQVVNAVAFHHKPGKAPPTLDLLAAVHIAESLSHGDLPDPAFAALLGDEEQQSLWLAEANDLRGVLPASHGE